MRILHLDTGREMRGGQWQAFRLMERLEAAGVESTLLAREGGELQAAVRKRGLQVEALGWSQLAVLARKHDLVHAHDARAHTMAAAVAGGRTPLVVSRRVAFPVGAGIGSRWKYRRATRYLAVSEYVRQILISGGVDGAKVSVVYDGVPSLPPTEGRRVVTPHDGGDPLKGNALAVEAGRRAGVVVEVSKNLEEDLRTTGIFVYLTRSEGLGSGALLAMSAAAAVVASDVGGLREAIEHRVHGLLVENQPDAIAAAIGELVENPESARNYGLVARRRVSERFTVDRMVLETMEVYRQVLS
jgi:L-malate glycosyltransferase